MEGSNCRDQDASHQSRAIGGGCRKQAEQREPRSRSGRAGRRPGPADRGKRCKAPGPDDLKKDTRSDHAEGGGGGDAFGASVRSSSGVRKRPSAESSSMGTGGAWSSSLASEVGLGTGAGAGARSGTGLGAKPAEDGDSEVPGRRRTGVGRSDHCCQKETRQAGNKTLAGAETAAKEQIHGQTNRRSRSWSRAAKARQSWSWAGATLRTEEDRERLRSGARLTGQRTAAVRN